MDFGHVQSAGPGAGANGVDHLAKQPVSPETSAAQRQLIQAVRAINPVELFGYDSELRFIFNIQTRKTVVRVVDKQTGEIRLQLPPERVLQIAAESKGL